VLRLEERVSALIAHRVICVNHPQRDALVGRGIPKSKTFISMNVPDPAIFPQPFADARRVTARPGQGETFDLVYHGTMVERLGVDLIIRAVARLQKRVPAVRLHLWGNGDDLRAFEHLAHELRLKASVHFNQKGYPLQELPAQLNRMDVGVVGNRRNVACDLMLPVKLMEYISLGIPVVVPRLKTINYYFSEDMLAFYEPEDVDSMADAIYRLYSTPQLGHRQAAHAGEFLQTYGWHRQGPELADFYRQLVEN
jgi:glycosyltransferase involved in cell wall biosynthesis